MINYIFATQKPHHIHQNKEKDKQKRYTKKEPVRLYNWNQPIRHIEHYALTVIKRKNEPHSK